RLLQELLHTTPEPKYAAAHLGLYSNGEYVTKIYNAGQEGKHAYPRNVGGAINNSDTLTLSDVSQQRPGALFSLNGSQIKKVSRIPEGDVCAIGKLDPVAAGDLLGASGPEKIKLNFKKRFPVYQLAIATKDRKDDVRLSGALQKLVEEDAGLSVVHRSEEHTSELQS